ncbi:MAG: AIR synthase-related protein [Spirochaetales bacterium]|uniref:Phosphoribosylformylglycinamidine synthase subunit PurL n=1 Tax=Candidatus Thalassospirochaeta sargassi TaxID=3119039 RepID=A0AAJ1IDY2_9SPIO|nr:AIR synthase-related protein [Spirochaetales bacterium]
MRMEVFFKDPGLDGRSHKLVESLRTSVSASIENISIADIYITDFEDLDRDTAEGIFSDPVAQNVCFNEAAADRLIGTWRYLFEISYKTGVTNPTAITARTAIGAAVGKPLERRTIVQTARQLMIQCSELSETEMEKLKKHLYNPLIEQAVIISDSEWSGGKKFPEIYPAKVAESSIEIEKFDVTSMKDDELLKFSKDRLLALTLPEMSAVKEYYKRPDVVEARKKAGLGAAASDVEIEMIAQTWSEHCKHKILNAAVEYTDLDAGTSENIKSLFKEYIRDTTDDISKKKDYLRSVFHDNSGVIVFDDENLVCFKVETHNSPSALDPYGGAITGIVGVNRDILGTGKGARPIFNTNYLCFGDVTAGDEEIPEGLLHPKQIMEGVHRGIVDGGNQSGIPVVGGGFLFDDSYTGKPLVFCGTGGILPAEIDGEGAWINHVDPGHKAVMLGGRIGKDGIHGATFSSLALDEESPTSAVQIGDPITQKKMSDFLIEARDKGLYAGLTDNGAGGLSSSLGEMAESSGGIRIDLDKCPLKYAGLAPWEILVSESQERMSLAIADDTLEEFITLAAARGVEAVEIGEFTDNGYIDLRYGNEVVGLIGLDFLHDGLPKMELKAEWKKVRTELIPLEGTSLGGDDAAANTAMLLKLLAEPNIASKEGLIRQYDHEVQAQSVMKPFVGVENDAPSDGAVLRPVHDSKKGVTVTHGVCPRFGDADAYDMAACGVDEAYRAHIAVGGDPEVTSALDNFCWPDPVQSPENPDGVFRMAQLVRACKGLRDTCLAYGMPLISGKDSMKNESKIGGKKIPVRPTLLVSQMGLIEDVTKSVTSDFKDAGDLIYLLGETRAELGGSFLEKLLAAEAGKDTDYSKDPDPDTFHLGPCPSLKADEALELYRKLHIAMKEGIVKSCHDLSDGGLAAAAAESALGGRLGAEIILDSAVGELETARALFSETPSRFIATVAEKDRQRFEEIMSGTKTSEAGFVSGTEGGNNSLVITRYGKTCLDVEIAEIERAWKSFN